MEPIHFASVLDLAARIRSGELSPLELMEVTLRRIDEINPILNAFVSICHDRALAEARKATEAIASGSVPGPLAGIPLAVKDLEDVGGMITTFGSVPFRDNMADRDSIQVERLRKAGAIVVGKTNTPEFGFTGFTRNRLFGTTRNPWNLERTPGGSSGGSAAAVAGGMVPMATGSDGGGSIRIPATYSGCFGLKTSVGRIPWGPVPLLPLTGIVVHGPMTRTVGDAALYLDCVTGSHPAAPDSLPRPAASYLAELDNLPEKLNIAFSPTLGYATVQPDVMSRVEEAVRAFEAMGHLVELLEEPMPKVDSVWNRLFSVDIYGSLQKVIALNRKQINRTIVASLEAARDLTIDEVLRAQAVRTEQNRWLWRLFDRFDLLMTPAMPTEAFVAEGPPPSEINGKPVDVLDVAAFTYPFNISGHPAASVPAGFTESGMPVGLQIVGPRHRDDLVLQASRAFEKARPWQGVYPPLG
ncbi:MAG: amidase [Syntrophales bacterium]|jgi:aspartyl-tRNA(Asn)/glutamyl-tRNA(Gln) amidotransferase subunit A|nr:amidase [Syntrophales bacterium]MCK9527537.1 amidase [Syntrophales bacterium]MDX9922594.1 amidase [Syntrophales bacterium]